MANVLGVADLQSKFKGLSDAMKTRLARRMMVVGGRIVVNAAKQSITSLGLVRTGNMRKNVAIKRQSGTPPGIAEYHVGIRHGRDLTKKSKKAGSTLKRSKTGRIFKQYKDDPYYWTWHHFGWTDRAGKKHSGQRFLEKALADNVQKVTDTVGNALREELKKAGLL
jgi:HK97 gp10 family phage protein